MRIRWQTGLNERCRFDVNHNVLNGKRTAPEAITDLVGNFMAAPHRKVSINLDVDFNEKP